MSHVNIFWDFPSFGGKPPLLQGQLMGHRGQPWQSHHHWWWTNRGQSALFCFIIVVNLLYKEEDGEEWWDIACRFLFPEVQTVQLLSTCVPPKGAGAGTPHTRYITTDHIHSFRYDQAWLTPNLVNWFKITLRRTTYCKFIHQLEDQLLILNYLLAYQLHLVDPVCCCVRNVSSSPFICWSLVLLALNPFTFNFLRDFELI